VTPPPWLSTSPRGAGGHITVAVQSALGRQLTPHTALSIIGVLRKSVWGQRLWSVMCANLSPGDGLFSRLFCVMIFILSEPLDLFTVGLNSNWAAQLWAHSTCFSSRSLLSKETLVSRRVKKKTSCNCSQYTPEEWLQVRDKIRTSLFSSPNGSCVTFFKNYCVP
jgi:hypothetical protein